MCFINPRYLIAVLLRYFVQLSYNGSSFCGWQIQPNGPSVQAAVEQALSCRLHEPVPIVGAGRTDAGVHALKYFAHFDAQRSDLAGDEGFVEQLNRMLHPHISVQGIHRVPEQAHARFDALSRTYVYRIARVKDPFTRDFAYQYYVPLNLEAMKEASALLMTFRDFTSFSRVHTDVKTNNCTILDIGWEEVGTELHFTVTADRFLRNMVRAIVGTLIDVGKGKITPGDMHRIAEARSRSAAGTSVPGHGLYLSDITYPQGTFI